MIQDNFSLAGKTATEALAVAGAVMAEAKADRSFRGENYERNWDVYNNIHAKYFRQRLDEDNAVFKHRQNNPVKTNLCGFTVDLSARYLYGKASKIIRIYSKLLETQKGMSTLTKKFHYDSFFLDVARKVSIFGEGLVRLIPVDSKTNAPVYDVSTETSYPHPIFSDPRSSFVKTNRCGKIDAVVLLYTQRDYVKSTTMAVLELVVNDSRWIWKTDSFNLMQGGISTLGNVAPETTANEYGLDTEFVYLVNNDDLKSDLVDIVDLNIALDEALTDKQHFFQKHGWPQMVSEVDLSQVQFSPNKIWEIASDYGQGKVMDKFGFLTWDGKMEDHAKFVKNLERNIMILSNTAAISTGDLEAIGQLRSGAALITAHSVAIHKTEAKQVVWERNEIAFIKAIAQFDSYLHNVPVEARYKELAPIIRFPRDFVPGAEHERVQIQQIELNSHLRPLNDLLQENYGGLDDEQIDEKRQLIIKDSEEIIDSARLFESVKADQTPMQKSKTQTRNIPNQG